MSIIINTNISSMLGVTALNKNTNAMNKALERLSTGCRINSSKDDAAGCAISTSLTKEVSSLNVAQNNAQMGQSLIDTANGALNNMSNMLQRLRDLAEQSANGTYGADERKAMQTEVSNLVNELYRTKNSTEFNGKQILGAESTHPITEEEAIAQNYTIVKTAEQLKTALTTDADCKVMLFADINLDDLETVDGSNWTAVGKSGSVFNGTFDGNGFTISNLKINKPNDNSQGLFGFTYGAAIKNVTLENVDVTGNENTGGLVGFSIESTISNCSSSGSVTGNGNSTGGLVGQNYYSSTIENCTSSGSVTGNYYTGGLVGQNTDNSPITNCSASVEVTGEGRCTGGLVGYNNNSSTISNCSSTGSVTGIGNYTGGLVGFSSASTIITNCGVSGEVTGGGLGTGGLVGYNTSDSTIKNSSSSGSVTGNGNATGGLV